ncbi:DUF2851 family protein [Leptobacterium sp. I13]|uniref:DUF2851 family protein n=1 Tax=Leptobacterium meishanense TaxID=3128904 RepID=UPI0030EF0F98
MKEDFLQYIWKYKKMKTANLQSTAGETIYLVDTGIHNLHAGPDFFNAKLSIGEQLWAGNVEIHVKSSDWYAHGHEKDKNYNNVILHVVWEHDIEVYRSDNTLLPTLELKDRVSAHLLDNYNTLVSGKQQFINCENSLCSVNSFVVKNWLERLYFERLENKATRILEELEASQNDWEAVLFKMLMRNFGLNINGEAFYEAAKRLDFAVVRKVWSNPVQLEALLMGVTGLLKATNLLETYPGALQKEYAYLKNKFVTIQDGPIAPKFFKLRPANFPTVRLSQLATLYYRYQNLFSEIIKTNTVEALYKLFDVATSVYWETHYTFGKQSREQVKKVSKSFIDLLIINTILPIKFCYAKYMGNDENDVLLQLITAIKAEKNSISDKYKNIGMEIPSALESQGVLQLYNDFCMKNNCLRCAVGNTLLKG